MPTRIAYKVQACYYGACENFFYDMLFETREEAEEWVRIRGIRGQKRYSIGDTVANTGEITETFAEYVLKEVPFIRKKSHAERSR